MVRPVAYGAWLWSKPASSPVSHHCWPGCCLSIPGMRIWWSPQEPQVVAQTPVPPLSYHFSPGLFPVVRGREAEVASSLIALHPHPWTLCWEPDSELSRGTVGMAGRYYGPFHFQSTFCPPTSPAVYLTLGVFLPLPRALCLHPALWPLSRLTCGPQAWGRSWRLSPRSWGNIAPLWVAAARSAPPRAG